MGTARCRRRGAAVPVFGPVATAAGTGVGVDGYAVWQVFEGDAAAVAARVARLRELDAYDGFTFSELMAMSASTIDRYLKPLRDAARPKGLAATRPAGELLRNSITIRKASDELDGLPGNVEADTVAHCGPSLKGEFCRTLTVVDFATGWTENASARNNAYRNLPRPRP